LSPFEDDELLNYDYGITNLVARATGSAGELSSDELRAGARRLERKVRYARPAIVAFVGVTAYRVAFDRPNAGLAAQAERIAEAYTWVLPNPSGLNAHYQLRDLTRLFRELRDRVG
jgi:TDG/mug DNA glycosylase family protein